MLHSNKTELFHSRLTGRKTKSRGKSLFFCVQDSRSLVQCWKGYVDLSLEEGALCWVLLLIIVADADTKVLLIVTSWAFWELSHCHGPVLFFTGMWWETACSAPGYERNEGSRKQRGEVYYQVNGRMGSRTRDSSKAAEVWDCTCTTVCEDFVCCFR